MQTFGVALCSTPSSAITSSRSVFPLHLSLSFLCICRRVSPAEEQHILPRAEKHRIRSYKISTDEEIRLGISRAQWQPFASDSLVVCDVDPALIEKLKKFRFQKETNNTALIRHLPRAADYRYVHDDGRISYPLCFIFSSPAGCKPEQQMMYAGSKNRLVQAAELTKVFEIRSTEELTEQWLKERLAFFR
ncbi:hypothetical protein E2320_000861 [Naja naja]|nr:hypothetical protein E2320_000861 [Naja naja]